MSTKSAIADLEKSIDHFYGAHSAKRVAMAALLVGVVSIGISWGAYYFSLNVLITTGVFALTSLLMVNIAMFSIVPPTQQLADSKALLLGALKNPIRIKSVGKKKVTLADSHGHVRGLSRLEQEVWEDLVIPHFIKMSAGGGSTTISARSEGLSNPERKVLEKRQAELSANEKKLLAEREKLQKERADLDARAKELKKMEDKLENRMSRVEASEDDLVRLKENLQRRIKENQNVVVDAAETALLEEKTAELKAKELALESAKQELANDRDQLDAQKAKLESLQSSLQRDQAPIENKTTDLQQREKELDERMRYVANVENDLIDRLNKLSEREASVEQTEVEVGIRQD